jgi:tRNA-2-methylthio-N6-dimethylallyladenosine synthase
MNVAESAAMEQILREHGWEKSLEDDGNGGGRLLFHKSLYRHKKTPYPNLPRVRGLQSPGAGLSPISTAAGAASGGNLSARDDTNTIGYSEKNVKPIPQLVILNTCSVRATAEQRILGRLAHWNAARRRGGAAKNGTPPFAILVAGCAAANIADALRKGGADYLLPPAEKHRFADILIELEEIYRSAKHHAAVNPADNAENNEVLPEAKFHHTAAAADGGFSQTHYTEDAASAFVPVMSGCDNFCSYCIVPYLRGRETSRPPDAITKEIDFLAQKGVREITLLGQNVNAYKNGGGFAGLVRLAARRIEGTPIRWIRFLSAHPKDMGADVIEALAENPCFCRHIHLPLQHGSDRILAAMNRRYTRAAYLDLTRQLRAALPSLTLTTDILVGFPGETEDDIECLLSLMNEVRFDSAFMYHYNPRKGTAAYHLPGRIDEDVKRERLGRVIELQNIHTKAARQAALGAERLVLCDKPSRKNSAEFLCHSEHDEMCVIPAAGVSAGDFLRARFTALEGSTFKAEHAALL